jgi:hypothetical protein
MRDAGALCGPGRDKRVEFIAPPGHGLLRVVVRNHLSAPAPVFFLELADTRYGQMELSFCIIADPAAPRFDVDRDLCGRDTCFATMARNIPEEVRAMAARLFSESKPFPTGNLRRKNHRNGTVDETG